ncbi:MAG: D-glycerate dehydrogenase, partial [Proteobacteria bacterium]|nr:D-glycerate dehydrogenase [Pseudomonadota bacterium]
VPTVTDKLTKDILSKAGDRLKLIASFGTGVDHIDLAAAKARGITVTNTPGVLSEDTADVAMALILSVPRRLVEGDSRARSGNWTGWSPTGMLGHRINGKRLGIIGMGQIGQAIARRARGFGMSVHYHNRKAVHPAIEAELEATYWDNLDEMLRRMDIVSVNCPYTEATKGLVSAERLALMPEHAYLVNTARGEIVDEQALAHALETGAIAGAGLDVYADEPSIPEGLRARDNVVLLPHIGSATIEGRHAMGDKVIINIQTFLDGHTPPDRVLAAML